MSKCKRVVGADFVVLLDAAPTAAPAQNGPPVANAGLDQTFFTSQFAHLNGTASDPDGDPVVAWFWSIDVAPPGGIAGFDNQFMPSPPSSDRSLRAPTCFRSW